MPGTIFLTHWPIEKFIISTLTHKSLIRGIITPDTNANKNCGTNKNSSKHLFETFP
jgi:hypothetical protein